MKYGQLPKSQFTSRNGISIGDWIEVDMSKENLKKHGFAGKRNWDGIVEFKITHLFENYAVGLSGSLDNMMLPYKLLVK